MIVNAQQKENDKRGKDEMKKRAGAGNGLKRGGTRTATEKGIMMENYKTFTENIKNITPHSKNPILMCL